MGEVAGNHQTEVRKAEHIRINLEENVQFPRLTTGLEHYQFVHQAVPEVDLASVDTRITFLDKTLSVPLLISSMTGGTEEAKAINLNLATAAQALGLAMGVGSQRAAIEDPNLASTFQVRSVAPDIPLFANLGAIQLNYGYGLAECQRAVEMIGADALILHLNVLQEAVQPEGDVNFGDLLSKIEVICRNLDVPVIAKEVGWGMSEQAARQLSEVGVTILDVAGAGGTSWSEVEYHRAPDSYHAQMARAFADWGIPTAYSLIYAHKASPATPLIASGGLRDGIQAAKCIALGASLVGYAGPFLKAAVVSVDAVVEYATLLKRQLEITMQCVGARTISDLAATKLVSHNRPPSLEY